VAFVTVAIVYVLLLLAQIEAFPVIVPALFGSTEFTVTPKAQVLVLPLPSVAVLVTVVVPAAKELPEDGLDTTTGLPQLSVPVTVNVTTAWQVLIFAFTVMLDEQLITGTWLSTTVTVNEQVAVFPLPSVAVPVTVVFPNANVLPEAGEETTAGLPQLSVAVVLKVATAVQFPDADMLTFAGQLITGTVLSTTRTVNEQVELFPLPSVAVPVTVVFPKLKVLPETGEETTVALPQLSVAVMLNVAVAVQLPFAVAVIFEGQMITGAVWSTTLTVNEQLEVFPLPSVAVPVTVVFPDANVLPETGLDTTDTPGQLSVAVTLKFTVAVQLPLADAVILEGQLMTGAVLSTTAIVNEQVLVLLFPSVAVPVTVVLPNANVLPDAGTDTTVTVPQLSPAVVLNVTTALQLPDAVVVIFDGQLITGT
jgi:hypothetical protein